MKNFIAFLVVIILSSAVSAQVFSPKSRKTVVKRTFATKSETPAETRLQNVAALTDGNGVYIYWQAELETQNLGFYVYRVNAKGVALASENIVGGAALTSSDPVVYGRSYSFYDPQGSVENSYYIESFEIGGKRQIVGNVKTQYVADLSPVSGATGEQMRLKAAEGAFLNNDSLLNLPKEVQYELEINSLAPDPIMQRWVAAQPGVKIEAKQEGIYRVSRAQLQSAGFDVSAPGNQWQLWMDGKQQAIIVGANDSYIEFYGIGEDTPESGSKIYFLLVGAQDGLRMGTMPLRNLAGNVLGRSYNQTFVRKDRVLYFSADVLNGDEENFFGGNVIGNTAPVNFTFNLTAVDFSLAKANFELSLLGIVASAHNISVRLNGETLDPMIWVGKTTSTSTYQIPTSFLREGANTLQLQGTAGATDLSVINSIKVNYFRKYEAMGNRLSFYTNNYRQTTISGFTAPDIRVFDLTNPDNPAILTGTTVQNNGGNYAMTMPSNRGRRVFATGDAAILAPNSIVQNTPSTLSTPTHSGELIIVSYKDWMTQANDWANYRRSQGMTVEVVNIEDILDEFGYGSVSTAAIRQFFQYAKNNWQTPPNYILLIGDASYDFKGYETPLQINYVPTKRVDTLYEETGSDEALSDFNNDGLAEIAIGRIPARTAADATRALNKTQSFEATIATAQNRGATCVSDNPIGFDFQELCNRLFTQLPTTMPKTFINRAQPDVRTLLLNDFSQGRYLINYSGHGSLTTWANTLFTNNDVSILNNAPNYSMYFMLTCLNGYFLLPGDSLGEALLKAQNGGGVAVWASTGKTTPDVQELMARRFYNQLTVSNMNKIGDLIKDAKTNLVGGRDVRLSWALLGDPTLRVK